MNRIIVVFISLLLICCTKNTSNLHKIDLGVGSKYFNNLFSENNIPDTVKIIKPTTDFYPISGTVSHHLLVAPIINEWFLALKKARKIDTFIIISPMHYKISNNIISISKLDWDSPIGIVKNNSFYTNKILKELNIKENEYDFHLEHGIASLIPFIKYYFPESNVVPIVMDEFNKRISLCYKLSSIISQILQKHKNCFLIISSDFSHGGDRELTDKRDLLTNISLQYFDKDKINGAYSDNNVGLITLYSTLEKLKVNKIHFLNHTDSEIFTGIKQDNITSYFFTFQY
ncbi:MAG: AmmeMemoRadiSam system protein B [Spirochaetes bacterium GWD1_27_9]|nr:MAG: AmmeMemoRadiSam system protein B [Spirochaetes bacterium GWB1_27_13]OHD24636.1 MAG: AmmeMemoRadiSam system protein B [Spirochaetes bacterium GWC1_27_15]OHD44631.1 MAG: AmmeMemoRadiSam system protein B [Spirochaetes bacterium GWD1_27_9]